MQNVDGGVTDLIGAVTPSLIGGLLALSGVIVLFTLQQAAARREERRRRLDDAAERLMETFEVARRAFTDGGDGVDRMPEMLMASWRFTWLLDRRDEAVVRWVWHMLIANIPTRGTPAATVSATFTTTLAEVMSALNDWRLGSKTPTWFRKDLARRRESPVETAGRERSD